MRRRWGVGFYRGGQSLGEAANPNPNSDPDSNTYGDPDSYADAHSDPDGYTNGNGNGYVYADANPNRNSNRIAQPDANTITDFYTNSDSCTWRN
jgi:hypothetical protein